MPVLDTTEFDFSHDYADGGGLIRRAAIVRNEDAHAVLHVGVKSPVAWLDAFPSEFALAPQASQAVTLELRPERAKNGALSPVSVSVFGQYLAMAAADAAALPADVGLEIRIVPPLAGCPHCGAEMPTGARECRRCGERIRLCPVCGIPNNWRVKVCRLSASHLIRAENDWLVSPGGGASHASSLSSPLPVQLARRWSFPAFPPTREAEVLEWSAPLAAFGLVAASAIETGAGRASVMAWETATGGALWDFDLPDGRGIYPDRGAMALSEDGHLYAATLGGFVVALDAIRGTRQWETRVNGTVYGGVTVAGENLLVPCGQSVCVLDRATGVSRQTLPVGGRLDTAPAVLGEMAVVCSDDSSVYAFDLATGEPLWTRAADGPFDAAPLCKEDAVYTATMAGTVYRLDAATGEIVWQRSVTSKPVAVTPALSSDGLLFVTADDGFVHIVDSTSGNLIRSRRVANVPLRTSPVVSGHTVFLGADDGIVYALDADYAVHRAYETTPGARLSTASPALSGDTLAAAATNGVLYVLRAIG